MSLHGRCPPRPRISCKPETGEPDCEAVASPGQVPVGAYARSRECHDGKCYIQCREGGVIQEVLQGWPRTGSRLAPFRPRPPAQAPTDKRMLGQERASAAPLPRGPRLVHLAGPRLTGCRVATEPFILGKSSRTSGPDPTFGGGHPVAPQRARRGRYWPARAVRRGRLV